MFEFSICDSHVHIDNIKPVDESAEVYRRIINDCNYEKIVIHALPSFHGYAENYEALYCKAELSPKVYASAGLCHNYNAQDTAEYYLEEIKRYYAMGFDGVKILDGKPNYRKRLGRRLDDKVFDKFFVFCEENGIPVTIHVGDPAKFWDYENAPEWQKEKGWVYSEDDPSLEQLRSETYGILKKFPKLKMVIAHFNFMSGELDRVAENFEKWEGLHFDLTPGGEMYIGFTENYDKAKAVFVKYSDRILYGTDASNDYSAGSWTRKALNIVRPFMEGTEEYVDDKIGTMTLKPFGFSGKILENIYRNNFVRLYGEDPRPLDYELIAASIPEFLPKFKLDSVEVENLKLIENYFRNKR